MYFVTRYIDGQLTGYAADNWNHVACLIAVGKVVSVLMPNGTLRTF